MRLKIQSEVVKGRTTDCLILFILRNIYMSIELSKTAEFCSVFPYAVSPWNERNL